MPDEIDFSGGTRGRFHRAGATLDLPRSGRRKMELVEDLVSASGRVSGQTHHCNYIQKPRFRCTMSARDDQVLIEKLKSLPPQRRAEVEDFVDFLKSREDEHRLTHAAAQASEPAFKSVWHNPEDADYDRL